jgi:hypothetical protein
VKGEQLDELGACYAMCEWIAGATLPTYQIERDRRYEAVVKLLEEHGSNAWPHFRRMREDKKAWPPLGRAATRAALRAQCVAVGRAAKRAEREEARGDGGGGGASASQKGTPST